MRQIPAVVHNLPRYALPVPGSLVRTSQQASSDDKTDTGVSSLLPLQNLRRLIPGSVVNPLTQQLPADEEKLADIMQEWRGDLAREFLSDGLHGVEVETRGKLSRRRRQWPGR